MLIDKLNEIGALKFGKFKWVSGIEAPYYVDLRLIPSYPDAFDSLVSEMSQIIQKIPGYGTCVLAGVPTAGISFATAVARELKLPLIYVRKQEKQHGTKKMIEGVFEPDQEVIVVEDLVSKGGSILKTVETLRENGAIVNHSIAVLDHGVGGKKNLEDAGVILHTITTTPDAARYLNQKGKLQDDELKTVEEFINAQN